MDNTRLIKTHDPNCIKVKANQTDLEEFMTFYHQTIAQIYAYMCYRADSLADAEDLTADTYEKVMRKWNFLRRDDWERKAWMFRVARNLVVDYHRKRVKRCLVSLDSLEELTSDENEPEDRVIHWDEAKRIREYLALVPELEREVAALRFSTELSYREIAHVLGLTETNVGTLLNRTIKRLRGFYEQDDK